MNAPYRIAHCGSILHFLGDPGPRDEPASYQYWEHGALILADGHVEAVGPAAALLPSPAGHMPVIDHGNRLIMPGFIDTHIHYPQSDVIASGGRNLLDWLERYTFPAEKRFAEVERAFEVAEFFLDELLRNGTTTAQVLGTVHKQSVDMFFRAAAERGLRMIAGKTLMDRNCPEDLRDSAVSGEREMRELIETWHGRDRMHYAITPRFAATSSPAQLQSAGQLAREYPGVFIHSHLAETRDEVAWVQQLFPIVAVTSRSTTASGCRSAPPTRTASTSMPATGNAWRRAAPVPRSRRPPTCTSAADCSISPPVTPPACVSRWLPTSAAAAASACCAPWRKPTRSLNCSASNSRRCGRSTWQRWRAHACLGSLTVSGASAPGTEADYRARSAGDAAAGATHSPVGQLERAAAGADDTGRRSCDRGNLCAW